MAAMDKLRVLCLHGYRQNGDKLRGRMAALRRAFKSSVEFVFLDAPIVVPYEPTAEEHASKESPPDEDVRQFAWWNGHHDEQTGEWTFSLVDEAVEFLAEFVRKEGPFDGVFGFSQGGMTASMLLQRQLEKPSETPFTFKFGIFVAAATCADPKYASSQKVNLPSVHVIGETDAVVTMDRSKALLDLYENPTVYYHSGGHYIPTNKEAKDVLRDFIKKLQEAGEQLKQ